MCQVAKFAIMLPCAFYVAATSASAEPILNDFKFDFKHCTAALKSPLSYFSDKSKLVFEQSSSDWYCSIVNDESAKSTDANLDVAGYGGAGYGSNKTSAHYAETCTDKQKSLAFDSVKDVVHNTIPEDVYEFWSECIRDTSELFRAAKFSKSVNDGSKSGFFATSYYPDLSNKRTIYLKLLYRSPQDGTPWPMVSFDVENATCRRATMVEDVIQTGTTIDLEDATTILICDRSNVKAVKFILKLSTGGEPVELEMPEVPYFERGTWVVGGKGSPQTFGVDVGNQKKLVKVKVCRVKDLRAEQAADVNAVWDVGSFAEKRRNEPLRYTTTEPNCYDHSAIRITVGYTGDFNQETSKNEVVFGTYEVLE